MEKHDGLKHSRDLNLLAYIIIIVAFATCLLSALALSKVLSFHLGSYISSAIAFAFNAIVFFGVVYLCIFAEKWRNFYHAFDNYGELIVDDVTPEHRKEYYNNRYIIRYHFRKGRLVKIEHIEHK